MILDEKHERWPFFCLKMMDMAECEHDQGYGCHTFTMECLNLIPGIDIPATIEGFKRRGGHCDCEVVMNLCVPSMEKEAPVEILDNHIVIKIPGHDTTYDIPLKECRSQVEIDRWTRQLCEKRWITEKIVLKFRKLAGERLT